MSDGLQMPIQLLNMHVFTTIYIYHIISDHIPITHKIHLLITYFL